MKSSLQDLLQKTRQRRQGLLKAYDEHELHQLRVGVRRLRALLRYDEDREAWQLRREWGYLVSHTNAMRDWDTLAARIAALPDCDRSESLENAVARKRKQIWRRTRQSLASDDWGKTLHRTRSYLVRHPDEQTLHEGGTASIDEASKRLAHAWARARTRDSDRAWHKLRIAVKDLRYSLDTLAPDLVDYRIELCIALQAQLGTWHDSVVHRELIAELAQSLGSEDAATAEAAQRLQAILVREGERCLTVARQLLADSETLLGTDADAP